MLTHSDEKTIPCLLTAAELKDLAMLFKRTHPSESYEEGQEEETKFQKAQLPGDVIEK